MHTVAVELAGQFNKGLDPIIKVNIGKRLYIRYPDDYKQQAVALVTEQNSSVVEAAVSLCITKKLLYNWV